MFRETVNEKLQPQKGNQERTRRDLGRARSMYVLSYLLFTSVPY